MGPRLEVDFCGEIHEVRPGEPLTFGRAADLVIDEDNPYLHRQLGRIRYAAGVWWLDNLGSLVDLSVVGRSGARIHLPASAADQVRSAALVDDEMGIEFRAGTTNYRIDVRAPHATIEVEPAPADPGGDSTVAHGQIVLVPDERLLLSALAAPRLLDPLAGPTSLPSNREVADRFGWKLTTYNRKLDRLCERFRRAGVAGLQGSRGAEAANRRWVLVEHAVASGLVTVADLGL